MRSPGGEFATFNVAGFSTTGAGQINDNGEVVGVAQKLSGLDLGFVRNPSGTLSEFEAPGAGLGAGYNQGTASISINASGTITGYYYDVNKVPHGFVRF